jgi:hypothetical protein
MSTSYIHYPNTGGGGGGGDVVGPASSPSLPAYAFPLALFADSTGKLLSSYSDVNYWLDGTLTIKGMTLRQGDIGQDGLINLSATGFGLHIKAQTIAFPGTVNFGVWQGSTHYNFLDGSLNRLSLGYEHGDAYVAGVAGSITVKPGVNLTVSADKALFSAGIGVGNSAAATTPGSIVRKIEIFDAAGTSLGFIPVYNTIT